MYMIQDSMPWPHRGRIAQLCQIFLTVNLIGVAKYQDWIMKLLRYHYCIANITIFRINPCMYLVTITRIFWTK